ncbi:hypothetical protein OO184_07330 [Photorhabdus sp. APURE]|uniref:hypothetical protein n=1 Tax=Photorhabdus aballayi TaxID=2991723 RepID=UPI00223E7C27|nr:hypothetical protein [Photorhabdus aballayi]MCW7547751.1 hypothetical protein [Photorhabdus aballayi]
MPGGILRKRSLLIPSGYTDHLYIICCDPVFYPKKTKTCFLAVNISSLKPDIPYDRTCILNCGDHPFIRHPSFVFYGRADIFGSVTVEQHMSAGDIKIHEPCGDSVFNRILSGFDISPHVTLEIRNFYKKYCIN